MPKGKREGLRDVKLVSGVKVRLGLKGEAGEKERKGTNIVSGFAFKREKK